jgi:carboxyl-terminal processing protease
MRKADKTWIGTILVVVTLATAAYLTFWSTSRSGLEIEVDERDRTESLQNLNVPEEMQALTDLFRTINLVQKRYLDPTRIDPEAMFIAALRSIQFHLAKVMVREKEDAVTVRLGTEERRFLLKDLNNPWVLLQRMKEVFDFLTPEFESENIELQEVEYAAINGMLKTLDPHSVFLNADQYREMRDKTQGKFAGLGIVISIRDGVLTIISPIDGTPADLAGLSAGDQIVKIDEESTVNMSLNDAVDLLRGDPGTTVTVYILRKGWAEPRPFTIVRAIVKVDSLESHMLKGRVGYVKIKDFQGNTPADVQAIITKWQKTGLGGLVLDLRGCPGGLLEAAVQVSDLFLKNGVIVTTAGQGPGERDVRRAVDTGDEPHYPLIVLVDRGSASASEIVAGALKNHKRALLIGERTFGKGSVQILFEFQSNDEKNATTALKLTTAQYLTPGDISIQSLGVVPHVEVLPMRADEEIIDLKIEDGYRESDLDQHFEMPTRTVEADGPRETLSYLWSPPKDAVDKGDSPDGGLPPPIEEERPFEPDYAINLARDLIARMARSESSLLNAADLSKQLEEKREIEERRLVSALKKLGIDWREGRDTPNPKNLSVALLLGENGLIQAGEEAELTIRVTNSGPGTFFRLGAASNSDFRPLDDRELAFGSVGPGKTIERKLKFPIPKDAHGQVSDVRWSFSVERGTAPGPVALRFTVAPLLKPHFAYRYTLDDTEKGNGDGKLQPGESVTLQLDIRNVGAGESINTYATLKSLSQKELFMIRGREQLEQLKPEEQKSCTFAFDIKPGFKEEAVEFELAIADVDLRVYLVEKLRIPVKGGKKGDSLSNRGVPSTMTGRLNSPPTMKLGEISYATRLDTLQLTGRVTDETRVRDVYIFVGEEKLFFKSNRGKANPKVLDFKAELPLKNGLNYITIVAEETADLEHRQVLVVRRDRVDGMPYLQSRLLNGEAELLGVIPQAHPSGGQTASVQTDAQPLARVPDEGPTPQGGGQDAVPLKEPIGDRGMAR